MRDIDFIPIVIAEIAPHLPQIERRFNEENEAYKALFAKNHDAIGRILKCHLIIENYINRHLEAASPNHNWSNARLSFKQKIDLLPIDNLRVRWILPGIREVNSIRNQYGHNLQAEVSLDNLKECISVLSIARNNKEYKEPMEAIEDFTTVACTWLIVDQDIEQIFIEAFALAHEKARV